MSADPGAALLRRMLASAGAAGVGRLELAEMASRDWASATFTGARHAIHLRAADDDALAHWLGELPDAAFTIAGHVIVDLAVTAVERRAGTAEVTVAALTVQA